MTRHVTIIGSMGSGKSTLGRGLADATGRQFFDSDEMINARTGRTGREIALDEGIDHLHSLEREVFFEGLATPEPSVVAAAASVIDDAAARRALAATFCVWVNAVQEVIDERLSSSSHRRLLRDDEGDRIVGRAQFFEKAADLMINTGMVSAQDAVALVVVALEGEAPS